MSLKKLQEKVNESVSMAVSIADTEPHRSLDFLEQAKKDLQEIYFEVWHKHHTSGKVGGTPR